MERNPEIQRVSQSLEPGEMVTLFHVDLNPLGVNEQYAFCPSGVATFQGVLYSHLDVEAEGFEWAGQGPLPQPKIRIVNATKVMSGVAREFKDLLGAKLTRIRTYKRFLDDGATPNPNAMYSPDIYVFEQKTDHTKFQIEWTLSAAMDQQGVKLPGRLVVRDFCLWRYRSWDASKRDFDYSRAQCPYMGSQSYDINGNPVTPDQDRPSRRFNTCCQARFGKNAVYPFGGFPGVSRVNA